MSMSTTTVHDDLSSVSNNNNKAGLISSCDVVCNGETTNAGFQLQGGSDGLYQTSTSEGEGESRQRSQSSWADDLEKERTKLISSMREKITELREQEEEIDVEIKVNEDLGKKIASIFELNATHAEFAKFELFIGELKKIVALLLSLTARLRRYELILKEVDNSKEDEKEKKEELVTKIEKLKSQHKEACYLRDVNNRRGDNVATILEKYCCEEEFEDFQYYVDMKAQLALMQSEIREKVKLGEERLKALEQTNSECKYL